MKLPCKMYDCTQCWFDVCVFHQPKSKTNINEINSVGCHIQPCVVYVLRLVSHCFNERKNYWTISFSCYRCRHSCVLDNWLISFTQTNRHSPSKLYPIKILQHQKNHRFSISWCIRRHHCVICIDTKAFTNAWLNTTARWWHSPWYQFPFHIGHGQGIVLSYIVYSFVIIVAVHSTMPFWNRQN